MFVAVVVETVSKSDVVFNSGSSTPFAWEDLSGTIYSIGFVRVDNPTAKFKIDTNGNTTIGSYACYLRLEEHLALSGGWGGIPDIITTAATTPATTTG